MRRWGTRIARTVPPAACSTVSEDTQLTGHICLPPPAPRVQRFSPKPCKQPVSLHTPNPPPPSASGKSALTKTAAYTTTTPERTSPHVGPGRTPVLPSVIVRPVHSHSNHSRPIRPLLVSHGESPPPSLPPAIQAPHHPTWRQHRPHIPSIHPTSSPPDPGIASSCQYCQMQSDQSPPSALTAVRRPTMVRSGSPPAPPAAYCPCPSTVLALGPATLR